MTYRSLITVSIAALLLASPAAAGPTPTSKKDDVASTNQAALRQPSDASVVGALHEFAYERGALYAIQASPQRITDIALEPGETLLSVSAGDTTRWIVADARSGAGPTGQAHVLVKPNASSLATKLGVLSMPTCITRRLFARRLEPVSDTSTMASSRIGGLTSVAPQENSTSASTP